MMNALTAHATGRNHTVCGLAIDANLSTIRDFETSKRTPHANNLSAIKRALEGAGVEFIDENGGGAVGAVEEGLDARRGYFEHGPLVRR
mgnify:CR=1 FL=1